MPAVKAAHFTWPGIGRPLRVLVVEDEPRLRELLSGVIAEMGYETTTVRSAEEALRQFETAIPDIAVLDLQLPGMSGMELLTQLRQRVPELAAIILTGYGDLETARRAIRLDVVDFLTKPFHLDDIETALDRARRRLPIQPEPSIDLQAVEVESETAPRTLKEHERAIIEQTLKRHNGNRTATAAELGISRRKLHYWLNEQDGE